MKRILSSVLNVLCVAIILLSILTLFSVVRTPAGQTPQVFGYSGFRVLTGSMEPAIRTDSFVLVKLCDASAIRVQDVITFYSSDPTLDGAINTHRVLEIHEENGQTYFITKGDHNPIPDKEPVFAADLIGRVIFASHALGVFVHLISNPLIFGALIVIPLALIIFTNLIGVAKDIKSIAASEDPELFGRREETDAGEEAEEDEDEYEYYDEEEDGPYEEDGHEPFGAEDDRNEF